MTYYLVRFLSRVVCLLPGRFCDRLGRALALALWPFLPARRKKLAASQVAMCLGTDERESARIAKESAVRFGPMLFEVLRFPVIMRRMADYVEIEGAEHLREGLSQGKGAVIATGHTGNWELMGGALSQAGFPIIGVAMRQRDAAMDRFINEYRRLVGMHIIYKNDVREMFRMMKEGWVVGLLADQDTNRHDGIVLDFLGRPTNCVDWHHTRLHHAQERRHAQDHPPCTHRGAAHEGQARGHPRGPAGGQPRLGAAYPRASRRVVLAARPLEIPAQRVLGKRGENAALHSSVLAGVSFLRENEKNYIIEGALMNPAAHRHASGRLRSIRDSSGIQNVQAEGGL